MSDREALAAALRLYEDEWKYIGGNLAEIFAAARERLAQLPQKCEHGFDRPHVLSGPTWVECPGRVYRADLVERIGKAATAFHVGAIQDLPTQIAVAVLDALNGTADG